MRRLLWLVCLVAMGQTVPFPGPRNSGTASTCSASSHTYITVGTTTWTVPSGCTLATFEVWGAGGTGGDDFGSGIFGGGGGGGGYGKADFAVTSGQVYTVVVASTTNASSVKLSGTNKVSAPSGLAGGDDGAAGGLGSSATIGVGGTNTLTRTGGSGGLGDATGGGGGGGGAARSANGSNGQNSASGGAGGSFGGGAGGTAGINPGLQPGGGGCGRANAIGGAGWVVITFS